jgi:hypothetical protein
MGASFEQREKYNLPVTDFMPLWDVLLFSWAKSHFRLSRNMVKIDYEF